MILKLGYLLFLSVVTSSPIFPAPPEFINRNASLRNEEYRLPEDAIEVDLYVIELRLGQDIFDSTVFEGTTDIMFKNLKSTNEIILHANKLDITQITLAGQDGTPITFENESFESNSVTDLLILTTSALLEAGSTYMIRFQYTGLLRIDGMHGFYRSEYVDANGNVRYLGTTQFQPVHARKVFPCFDEPSFKATFTITIRHPVEYTAISNARGSQRIDPDDETFAITSFATTPRMSTYLIAFVVSDFTCSQGTNIEDGIPHYICSRSEAASDRTLANEYGPKLTWALEEFTGVKYNAHQIPKIHQFAIPDFSAGAMENWGLVTYRERYLLWDPDHSSNRNLQSVVTIEAHELAHFWFGDLVTCDWWSNTFLNEGFATYFEYFATHDVDPSLETDKQFVVEQLQAVLVSDASPNSAPLSSPASSPAQISGRFSSISYNKGGSVFRMVSSFMGLDEFKKGINKYLTEHEFTNTQPEDLWNALQAYAPTDLPTSHSIPTLMEDWVNKAGYPLINVAAVGTTVQITQKRFLSSGQPGQDEQWYVPISYTTASDTNKFQNTRANFWLLPLGTFNTRILQDENDWIILNNQQTGYYRVDYDDNLWAKIKAALNKPGFDGIHELNRAQIVDDFFNFARYGYKSFSELLDLYQFLKQDTSYYSWYSAFSAFSTMTVRTGNEQIRRTLSAYILELAELFYNSVPFNEAKDYNHIYTLKKVLVVPWACRLGLQDCVDNSLAAFSVYKSTGIKPDKNMRSVIYCNGLRHSTDQSDWNFLWEEFQSTKLSSEQVTILSALGCSKDEAILKEYLRKAITASSGIRMQDANSVFSAVYSNNPEGVDVTFDFLIENYQDVASYYGAESSLGSLLAAVASRFTNKEQADKLEQFIAEADLGDAHSTAVAALAGARTNLAWIENFEDELLLYFTPKEETTTVEVTTVEVTTAPPGVDGTGAGTSLSIGITTFVTTLLVFCYQFLF